MGREQAPVRAPAGTHDVLWPESWRWEQLVAEFARRAGLAGFGLVLNPMFEDAALFRRGIGGEQRRGAQGDVRVHRPGRARSGAAPRRHRLGGAGLRAAPPAGAVEGVVRDARLPLRAPSGGPLQAAPPARGGSTRHRRPRRRRRGHRAGGRTSTGGSGSAASSSRSTPWDAPTCRPAYVEVLRAYLDAHRDELCDEHRERFGVNPLRVLDCKRPACRAVTEGAPAHHRLSRRGLRRPSGPGPGWSRRPGHRLPRSTPAWCGVSTTTPAPPSSSRRGR